MPELSNYTNSGRKKRIEWLFKFRSVIDFLLYRLDYETLKSPLTTYRYIASCLGYHEDTIAELFHVLIMRGLVKVGKYKKPTFENPHASRLQVELTPKFFVSFGTKISDLNEMRNFNRKKKRNIKKTSAQLMQADNLKKKLYNAFTKPKVNSMSKNHVTNFINSPQPINSTNSTPKRIIMNYDQTKKISDLIHGGKTKEEAYKQATGYDYPH